MSWGQSLYLGEQGSCEPGGGEPGYCTWAPMNTMTDTTKNFSFPQLRWRAVKNWYPGVCQRKSKSRTYFVVGVSLHLRGCSHDVPLPEERLELRRFSALGNLSDRDVCWVIPLFDKSLKVKH